jgi:hypothetical protein
MPSPSRLDRPQGTGNLLILQTLVLEPQHGGRQLDAQKGAWVRLTGAMARVLGID